MKEPTSSACSPRWATKRADRESLGPAVIQAAKLLGKPLMPWQEQVAMVGLELTDEGLPAYREVIWTTPRQSGKSTLIEAWFLQRAIGWAQRLDAPQKISYSAQTGSDARSKLLDDFAADLEPRKARLGISRIYKGAGNESITWKNGSKLTLLASLEDSGHGKTLDLGISDELFADRDYRRTQALVPAMATRPHAQMLTASTMGTPDSIAWNQKVAAGRAAVEAGKTDGVAYFEWSARLDEDPLDPATWWACMPALGRNITLPVVEHAYQNMPLGEFTRAWLNVMTVSEEAVIPALIWDLVQSNTAEADAVIFGLDVNPERDWGAIVACDRAPVVEVVKYQPGTAWIVAECQRLHERYGAGFVIDGTGPAAGIAADLDRAGVPVTTLSARDMVNACGRFYDAVIGEGITIRKHPELDQAVAGAVKRVSGDAWAWGRKSSRVDISLLVAATVAHWQSQQEPAQRESTFFVI